MKILCRQIYPRFNAAKTVLMVLPNIVTAILTMTDVQIIRLKKLIVVPVS